MKSFLILTLTICSLNTPVFADGIGEFFPPEDDTSPCEEIVPLTEYQSMFRGDYIPGMYEQNRADMSALWGCQPIWQDWRDRGFTDQDLIGFVFGGGSDIVTPPAPVPVPPSLWMMLAGIVSLFAWRKRNVQR